MIPLKYKVYRILQSEGVAAGAAQIESPGYSSDRYCLPHRKHRDALSKPTYMIHQAQHDSVNDKFCPPVHNTRQYEKYMSLG
jgi:hypothetical protein